MKKIYFVFSVLLLVAACATPYKQASKSTATGYFDTQLQENVYDITFNGNADTSLKKAKDYTLLRAAEVCLENGYQTFQVINTENNSVEETTVATHTIKSGTRHSYSYQTVDTIHKPQVSIVVLCSTEQDLFFKAEEVKNSLRAKYHLKPQD